MINAEANSISVLVAVFTVLIITILSVAVIVICSVVCFRLIKRQIKLYNSIVLVNLRSTKLHYLVFVAITSLFLILLGLSMADSASLEYGVLESLYGIPHGLAFFLMLCTAGVLLSVDIMLIALLFSRSAVVDRGIYTALNYIEWYHVHDYIIDENKCVVVLSSQKDTFATLSGTTAPLKVSKNDIPKLKFILNKNKNKFSDIANEV